MQERFDNEIWENKDVRMARMNSITNATNFLASCINAGILKPKNMDEAFIELNGYRNRIFDWIYADMKQHSKPTGEQNKSKETGFKPVGIATDKQRKAVWAIIHGTNGNPDLEDELSTDIDNLSFDEASDFIDKYGKKKMLE